MKRNTIIAGVFIVSLILLFFGAGTAYSTNEVPQQDGKCYDEVEVEKPVFEDQAKYRKFTSPNKTGPFTKEYPKTNWKNGAWVKDVGEIVSGPAKHSDGWYVYKRIEQRTEQVGTETVTEKVEVPCPIPPSKLGLTYNQDCAPDDSNTWRIRPVDVNQPVAFELRDAPGTYVGLVTPGSGEVVIDAPRAQTTAKLFYDSDGNGTLDKQTVKASGPDLTDPALYEAGAKCGPPQPEPVVEIVEEVDCEAQAVRITITTTEYVIVDGEWVLGEPVVEEKTRVLNDEEIAECEVPPTTEPPTTEPPTTEPPVTTPPVTEPPVNTPPPATPEQPTMLPETGNESWVIAGIAAALLAAGYGALRFSRRPA